MKKIMNLLLLSAFIILENSCGNSVADTKKDSSNNTTQRDTTMYDITRPAGQDYLEDLLDIKDEKELITKFGKPRISYDTIWGEEGMFTMGSFLDENTKDEVQFMWQDSLHRSGVSNVVIDAFSFNKGNQMETNYDNRWVSKKGIKLGMTTGEIEQMNGKPFVFSGFGWDLGGGIMDWNKGNLESCNLGITLYEGDATQHLPEKEINQVLGDHDVTSDNPVIKKIQPKIMRISVSQRY